MKDYLELIMWLLSLFAGAVLAVQIAYASTLAQDLKSVFGLNAEMDFNKYKWKPWFKPILVLWVELRALLNCPFCQSFWFGLIINLTLWDLSTYQSIVYALLSLVFVEVYMRLSPNE